MTRRAPSGQDGGVLSLDLLRVTTACIEASLCDHVFTRNRCLQALQQRALSSRLFNGHSDGDQHSNERGVNNLRVQSLLSHRISCPLFFGVIFICHGILTARLIWRPSRHR